MNLLNQPELLDRLACAYALGVLRHGARRRFETLAREHASVRAAALAWGSRLASFNELQASVPPAAAVWLRIKHLVRADANVAQMMSARWTPPSKLTVWWQSLPVWRSMAAGGALAAVFAGVMATGMNHTLRQQWSQIAQLQARLQAAPQVAYVAVLNDGQANAAMLVTFDPNNKRLTLQRVGTYQEAANQSLQLWALPPGGAPRSLGVMTQAKRLQLVAGGDALRQVPTLAISLEPVGGVPSERGPTGPVLFKGALIQAAL